MHVRCYFCAVEKMPGVDVAFAAPTSTQHLAVLRNSCACHAMYGCHIGCRPYHLQTVVPSSYTDQLPSASSTCVTHLPRLGAVFTQGFAHAVHLGSNLPCLQPLHCPLAPLFHQLVQPLPEHHSGQW